MAGPATAGVHHIGLSVARLEETADFFTRLLGWQEVRRDDNYPAIFVSDGVVMVSLWGVSEPAQAFDRRHNIGLHHLALRVASREALAQIHGRIAAAGLAVEFAPEPLRQGPAYDVL
jgi:catechol 2,3-dioxygenase-like lactoylglutathione lyase family enzyme